MRAQRPAPKLAMMTGARTVTADSSLGSNQIFGYERAIISTLIFHP